MENVKKYSRLKPQGLVHHLVDLNQVCSNYAPGVKNGPAPGVTYFTMADIGNT